jgi:hypothetical protein
MDARSKERQLLDRCVFVVRHPGAMADNSVEASVFRLAGSVLRSRLPDASARLKAASAAWFASHPEEPLASAELLRRGTLASLPRLRELLSRRLQWHANG